MDTYNIGISGSYSMTVTHEDGSIDEYGTYDNIITDVGIQKLVTDGAGFAGLHVGTGINLPNSPPNSTDRLATWRAYVAAGAGGDAPVVTYGGAGTVPDPYWSKRVYKFTFGKGACSGTLTELGFGSHSVAPPFSSYSWLSTYAVIPVPVVCTTKDILTVYYSIKWHFVDTGVDLVSTPIGGPTFTIRPYRMQDWRGKEGSALTTSASGYPSNWKLYHGIGHQLVSTTTTKSGTTLIASSFNAAVASDTNLAVLSRTESGTWDRTTNLTGEQSNFLIVEWAHGAFQMTIDPPITKLTNTQELKISMTCKIGRYPLS